MWHVIFQYVTPRWRPKTWQPKTWQPKAWQPKTWRPNRPGVGCGLLLLALGWGGTMLPWAEAAELRSIIEMQPDSLVMRSVGVEGDYRLILLNKFYQKWYILERNFYGKPETAQLEVTAPNDVTVGLDGAMLVVNGPRGKYACTLEGAKNQFFRTDNRAWTASCSPDLYVRHKSEIYASWSERLADRLRGNRPNNRLIQLWLDHGEKTSDPRSVYAAQLVGSCGPERLPAADPTQQIDYFFGAAPPPAAPEAAILTRDAIGQWLLKANFGLAFADSGDKLAEKRIGSWVALPAMAGIFASQITAEAAAGAVETDGIDADALVYLLAFDLAQLRLNFSLGAVHPAVGPVTGGARPGVIGLVPGEDGIANSEPLARVGQVPPWELEHLAASFNGGFKRAHSALGQSSESGLGSGKRQIPAGFIESGVVFSKLQPGFMTLYGLTDGSVGMQSWSEKLAFDTQGKIVFARQNGVAVIENGRPGPLINDEAGGWSGDRHPLRSALRSGVCLARNPSGNFLIYGLFTQATPAVMARVFSAYRCQAAMQLDMTDYHLVDAAVYRWGEQGIEAFSLSNNMRAARKHKRYIRQNDTKDFFWLTRKAEKAAVNDPSPYVLTPSPAAKPPPPSPDATAQPAKAVAKKSFLTDLSNRAKAGLKKLRALPERIFSNLEGTTSK